MPWYVCGGCFRPDQGRKPCRFWVDENEDGSPSSAPRCCPYNKPDKFEMAEWDEGGQE